MEKSKIKMSFGLPLNEKLRVNVSDQANLFTYLFINPELSTEKVKIMLKGLSSFRRHKKICQKCYEDICKIIENTNNYEEYNLLEKKMIVKIKEWKNCFILPSQREILLTCKFLHLNPEKIYSELY
jgi:hypothetical protein